MLYVSREKFVRVIASFLQLHVVTVALPRPLDGSCYTP